jgi:hypothetical protein
MNLNCVLVGFASEVNQHCLATGAFKATVRVAAATIRRAFGDSAQKLGTLALIRVSL